MEEKPSLKGLREFITWCSESRSREWWIPLFNSLSHSWAAQYSIPGTGPTHGKWIFPTQLSQGRELPTNMPRICLQVNPDLMLKIRNNQHTCIICVPGGHCFFIIPEHTDAHTCTACRHACIHVCIEPYLCFPSMFSETDYIPLSSFHILPTHPPLSQSWPDCSLFVFLFRTGQHFLPSGVFSFSHIQDLKLCSLHVLLFGPGAQCLCTAGHSHASERKAQFPHVLHPSPAPLQPPFTNTLQDYWFHFPGKLMDILGSLPPPHFMYMNRLVRTLILLWKISCLSLSFL